MKENREVTYTNVGDMENSIEEDIILLKDFTEGNFKRDKLENYKGSYKMGFFYYKDIQQAIEHILKENEQLRTEVNRFKEDISNMYDEEVIISIISDNFNLSRNEVLKLLGGE